MSDLTKALAACDAQAIMAGMEVPDGVNPKRLKRYRRKIARYQTRNDKLFRQVRRSASIPDPEILGHKPNDLLNWMRSGWRNINAFRSGYESTLRHLGIPQ